MKYRHECVTFAKGLLPEHNVAFQADKPLFYRMKLQTESLTKELSLTFTKKDNVNSTKVFQLNVNDPSVYRPLKNIYLGPTEEDTLSTLDQILVCPMKQLKISSELNNLFTLKL